MQRTEVLAENGSVYYTDARIHFRVPPALTSLRRSVVPCREPELPLALSSRVQGDVCRAVEKRFTRKFAPFHDRPISSPTAVPLELSATHK